MFNCLKIGNSEITSPQTGVCVALIGVPDDALLKNYLEIKPTADSVFSYKYNNY